MIDAIDAYFSTLSQLQAFMLTFCSTAMVLLAHEWYLSREAAS